MLTNDIISNQLIQGNINCDLCSHRVKICIKPNSKWAQFHILVPSYRCSEHANKIFVGKPERKGTLGRLKCRQEDNFRMDRKEIGWDDVD
jgi:hypothetical protein